MSTGPRGQWVAEHAWVDSPLSQGTSGGVSALFDRPEWQARLTVERDAERRRLTPDVAAVADPFTGVRFIFKQQEVIGGGTSQSAPIWAALTVLMNQYLVANGGRPLGNVNPLLYRVAAGSNLPGFRDVRRGGNAVDISTARLRPGDRAGQPQHIQPRPKPSRPAEGGGAAVTTPNDAAHHALRDMRNGRPCRAFCGTCGAQLSAGRGDGRGRLRMAAYAAAPGEQVLRLSVASSLFPHLPHRSRTPFRVGLAVLVLALIAFALLRWQAPLIVVCALGFPLVFLLYLHESDVDRDLPIRFLVPDRSDGHRARHRLGVVDRHGRRRLLRCRARCQRTRTRRRSLSDWRFRWAAPF